MGYFKKNLISLKVFLSIILKYKFGYTLPYPSKVFIEPTNECNLRCTMCVHGKGMNRKKGKMKMDSFMKIIDEVSFNKPWIILHMAGESFLHEDLFNMIEYAKRKVGCVSVHTNATLLDKEMSLNILKSPLDLITFSFDGCTSEIYEKLRVGANFEKVKAQIEIFFELKKRIGNKKLLACVEIIKMKETEKYIPDFVQYWKNKGVDRVVVRPYITWLGLVDDHRVNISYNFGHKLCHNLFWNSTILYDGTVVPCCIDGEGRLPLGNVLKQPFNEIWNGNHYNRLRSYHLENAIPNNIICHGCTNTWIISRKEGRIKRAILRQLGVIKNSKA